MLTTNDEEFAARCRSFVNQGRREGAGWFHHYTLGTNLRIAALQAAVLTAQLERLPEQIAGRQRAARRLRAELADTARLRFQDEPAEATAHSGYLLLGRIDQARFGATRDQFHLRCQAAGIPCTPFYPHPLYANPMYLEGGCRVEPCPVAEACIEDAFWFPRTRADGG